MSFNDLLVNIGGVNRFQILNTVMLLLPMLLMACHNFLQNFTAAIPTHRCKLPLLDNATMEYDIMIFIPTDEHQKPKSCLRYKEVQFDVWSNTTTYNNTEPCVDGWVYDNSVFSSTIVTEWNLVCNFRKMRQIAQSIYMAGVLVGAVLLGSLSDRFGRKALLIGSYLLMAVSGTCVAFLPSFVNYCVFRCLCGIAFSGIVLNTISLILEWTPPNGRTVMGTLFAYSFTTGQLLLAGLAFAIRDWRWLQFTVSVPYYLFFLCSWFVPESARWLILKGRTHQALKDLQRVARINGKKEEGDKLTEKVLMSHMQSEMKQVKGFHSPVDLFCTPGMRRVTICLMLVWFSTSLAFYGVGMDLQKFDMSIFLLQLVFGAIDIPAKLVAALLMSSLGRRMTQCATLMVAGLMLLSNAFVPQDMRILRIILAVIGKGCLGGSFACAYLFSGELFPTVVRQTGMGFVAMNARLGSMVAPLVLMLWEVSPILPPAIYGVAAMISGTAAIFLTETHNRQLPDTVEEIEARFQGKEINKVIPKEEIMLKPCQPELTSRLLPDTL
ncbi:solute carrier family 22 member 20-like [Spea bombifrons]|uniref:solute carrier family 22 member 20-like n=1 Tax=Spea bombifrons TaxID=233779 RepID=UPI00234A1DA2|nr:solute carrier family 22 member 20-like [Spea bombifrons]